MSIVEQPDTVRTHLHAMWSSVAPAWADHADFVDARGAALTGEMLAAAAPRPGDRVLELACGAGGLGLAAAAQVAPAGEVVLSDVAAEMTEIAGARAVRRGLRNVSTRVLDVERIEEPDASYDVVLCREGLMFALEPERGAREIARVLRSGGRAVVATWAAPECNPWLGIVLDAVSAQIGAPVPPPGVPGPFALADADRLAGLLAGAGLAEVGVREVSVPLRAASADEWWARTTALAGPLGRILAALPEPAAQALEARARAAAGAFATPAGLQFPGVTLVATGLAAEA